MKCQSILLTLTTITTILLTGCSPSVPAEQVPTSGLVTSEVLVITDTPTSPTETILPTVTSIPTYTPTLVPTDTPTVTPTFSPQTIIYAPGEAVKIGALLWLSNPYGVDSLRSIQLAVNEYSGEISGHPIELVELDEGCSELGGQRGAQRLAADEHVVAVIGTNCSPGALKAAPILSDAGKVMISPSVSHPDLTSADLRSAGFFRTAHNDGYQSIMAAEYAFNQLSLRKMASIYEDLDGIERRSIHLCQVFAGLGGACVLEKAVAGDATYMAPVINDTLESGADFVHISHRSTNVTAALLKALRETPGLENLPVFVFESMNNPDFLKLADSDAVGAFMSVGSLDFDQDTLVYQTFVSAYREKFGEDPISESHAFAYDAAALLLRAISRVVVRAEDGTITIDPLAVREELYRIVDFTGLTGPLACSSTGDCSSLQGARIFQFIDGDPATFRPGPADDLGSNPAYVWP